MAKQNGTSRSTASGGAQPSPSSSSTASRRGGGGGGSQTRRRSGNRSSARARQQQPQQLRQSRAPSSGRGVISGAGTRVMNTVKGNPIPAALIGAGLAWLLVKNRNHLPMPHVPQALSGLADAARDAFAGSVESTRDAVRGGVSSAAESVREGASSLTHYAQRRLKRGRRTIINTWDEHPLTVGLALLAAGLAAGMMLPAPRSAAITRAAKGLTERVTATGEQLMDTARGLIGASARAATREAKRQGLTPREIGRKVKRVAGAVTS